MNLTFKDDFSMTGAIELDSELLGTPDSGMYLNSGVHPSITIQNILDVLPDETFTFATYAAGTTYSDFRTTGKRSDVVLSSSVIYISIADSNQGNTPASSPTKWLATNIESLRMRAFIKRIEDKVKVDLRLIDRLVSDQHIYIVGDTASTPSGDFVGWAIEPKGSDYVKIEIAQMSCQATTTDAQTIHVINQGVELTTFNLTPQNGVLAFEDVNYTFQGKGVFRFVMAAREMKLKSGYIDPLRNKGFVAYTTTGTGATAETATYADGLGNNGLGLIMNAYIDSGQYVTNNMKHYGELIQATFEIETLKMMLYNSNVRNNTPQKKLMSRDLLMLETQDLTSQNNSLYRYRQSKKRALEALRRTFDAELYEQDFNFRKITP